MGANAGHDASRAAGGRVMPSAVTVPSVRGQPIFTTPSGVAVAVAPLACPIALASSDAGGAAMLSADISALATRHPAIHVTVIRKAAKHSYRRAFMIHLREARYSSRTAHTAPRSCCAGACRPLLATRGRRQRRV